MAIKFGDTFSSFAQFEEKLNLFQAETSTQFTILKSERLQETDEVFKYSVIRYGCKQGHRKHQPTEGGKRPKQRTFKVGCPVKLNVRLNRPKDKDPFLKITTLEMNHQNEVSNEIFQLYPEQRRFELDETSAIVLASSSMKTSEKREILEKRHGTAVLLQDVYNKEINLNGPRGTDEERCEELIKHVVEKGGVGVVGRGDNGEFQYCGFQTAAMKSLLQAFPQCFIMDCTYKVNNYLYPLLTIMVIDGEGHGMPVFHAFLAKEDRVIMEKCLEVFARQFDTTQTSCFVVDKDMAEIAAIGAIFPNVPINLCHFHISQAVDRYLRKELGRGASGVKVVRDLFMSQVYTESEEDYDAFKAHISDIVPQSVVDYFETNWWSKRTLWAACCNVNIIKLHATTTNALESYHSKIKKTVNEKLNLANTLEAIITFNDSKIGESRRQRLIASNCSVYDMTDRTVVMSSITKHMTRFGSDIVKAQLSLSETTAYLLTPTDSEGLYNVTYKDRQHNVSVTSCSCSTYGHMQLPCRHMFFLRKHLGCEVFEEHLIPDRYKMSSHLDISPTAGEIDIVDVPAAPASYRTIEGRHRKAKDVCGGIVNFLAILGEREFGQKIQELQALLDRWSGNADDTSHHTSDPGPLETPPHASDGGDDSPHTSDPGPIETPPHASGGGDDSPHTCTSDPGPIETPPHASGGGDDSPHTPDPGPIETQPHASGGGDDSPHTPDPGPIETQPHASGGGDDSPHTSDPGPIETQPHASVQIQTLPPDAPIETSVATGSIESFVWPQMSRLLRPKGRPGTKQSFTSRFSTKRRRQFPKPFQQLSRAEQSLLLIKAVSDHTSLPRSLIPCRDLKSVANFNDIVLDDKVSIDLIKEFFEPSAWSDVMKGVASRRASSVFYCGHCHDVDNMEFKMVQCEHCLLWFHFHCVNYSSKKKINTWFCDSCL